MLRKLHKLWLSFSTTRKPRPRLHFENLEVRSVPATIGLYSAGRLSGIRIDGTANHDTVVINEVGDQIEVRHTAPGELVTVKSYDRSWIWQIKFYGNNGNDTLVNNSMLGDSAKGTADIDLYAYGGTGIDHFTGGAGIDYFFGEGNNDVLTGRGGDDHLEGGSGRDSLEGGFGKDRLYGGTDQDQLNGGNWGVQPDGSMGYLPDTDPDPNLHTASDFLDGGNNGDTLITAPVSSALDVDFDAYNWVFAGATYDDVLQQGVNDCAFMSSLAACADLGEDLASRIFYRGNGSYDVRLYDDGVFGFGSGWYWETVQFAGNATWEDAGVKLSPDSQFGEFWGLLYQRAYLDYLDVHQDFIEFFGPTGFSFTGTAMSAITGRSYDLLVPLDESETFLRDQIRAALDQGRPVVGVMWAGDDVFSGPTSPLLETWHAYTVLGMEEGSTPGSSQLILRNPWGRDIANSRFNAGESPWHIQEDGLIQVTLSDFRDSMHDYYIGNVAGQADVLFDVRERLDAYFATTGMTDTIDVRTDPSASNFVEVRFNGNQVRRLDLSRVRSLTVRGGTSDELIRVFTTGLDIPVRVDGGGGANRLEVTGTSQVEDVDMNQTGIWVDTGSVTTSVLYSNVAGIQIDTLGEADQIYINGVGDAVTLTVNGGDGGDRFETAGAAGRALVLNGGNHDDIFTIQNSAAATTVVTVGVEPAIQVNGGDGVDNINVVMTAIAASPARVYLTVNGGLGGDIIRAEALDTQSLALNGEAGADEITVASSAVGSQVAVNGGLDADKLTGPNQANVWNVTNLNAGDINSRITFESTEHLKGGRLASYTSATVHNRFEVLSGATVSGQIEGGGPEGDRLIVHDETYSAGGTYTVSDTAVTLPDARRVAYANIKNLDLNSSSSGMASINVNDTYRHLQINTGSRNDAINIATAGHKLGDLGGAVTIAGGGNDVLTIDDTGRTSATPTTYSVTGEWLERDNAYDVNYSTSLGRLVINGGNTGSNFQVTSIGIPVELHGGTGADTVTAYGLKEACEVSFFGGAGSDTMTISEGVNAWSVTGVNQGEVASTMTLSRVAHHSELHFENVENLTGGSEADTFTFGALTRIDGTSAGGAGVNSLIINDASVATGRQYVLNTTLLTRGGPNVAGYSGMSRLTLNAGISSDEVTVLGTAAATPVTLNLGGSNNASPDGVEVGTAAASLAAVQGALTVNALAGKGLLMMSDQAAGEGHTYTLTSSTLQRNGAALITFTGMGELDLSTSNFDDTITVQSLPAHIVNFDSLGGTNTLVGPSVACTWQVQSTNTGTMSTSTATAGFTAFQNLTGGSGADRFNFTNGQRVTGTIQGSSGTDTLDFSAYSSTFALNLNLATGAANRGGAFLRGFENVLCGAGNDVISGTEGANILVGNLGNDQLLGQDGRDLLVGGYGTDALDGGRHDDILIGGYTIFDANLAALSAVMSEWTSVNSYADRIAHLRSGGGKSGTTYINPSTVRDDKQLDTFTGGADSDWFWAIIPGESNDRAASEALN
jgi:Ca2+-binding RTX toxin-like protein